MKISQEAEMIIINLGILEETEMKEKKREKSTSDERKSFSKLNSTVEISSKDKHMSSSLSMTSKVGDHSRGWP